MSWPPGAGTFLVGADVHVSQALRTNGSAPQRAASAARCRGRVRQCFECFGLIKNIINIFVRFIELR